MFLSIITGNNNISDLDSDKSWYMLAGKESFAEDNEESDDVGGGGGYLSKEELESDGKKVRGRQSDKLE